MPLLGENLPNLLSSSASFAKPSLGLGTSSGKSKVSFAGTSSGLGAGATHDASDFLASLGN